MEARIYSPDAPSWRVGGCAPCGPRLLHSRGHEPAHRPLAPEPPRRARRRRPLRGARAAREGPGEGPLASARSPRRSGATPRSGAKKLAKEGVALPPDRPSSRIRALIWLARRLGTAAVVPHGAPGGGRRRRQVRRRRAARRSRSPTRSGSTAGPSSAWAGASPPTPGSSSPPASGGTARRAAAGSIRAAIFGMNDGLVSNLSLILGVAGAGVEPRTVVVTGFAGLLAGAFSMAAGEYTSVASQRDLLARQVEMERREIAEAPEEEAAELALIFKQKGLSTEQASRTAAELLKNPEQRRRHPRARGARARPDRPRLAGARGGLLLRDVRGRGDHPDPPVPRRHRERRRRGERGRSPSWSSPASAGSSGSSPGRASSSPRRGWRGSPTLAAGVTYAVGRAFGATVG